MAWFGRNLKEPWAGTPPTGPGCSEQGMISFLDYKHCIWLALLSHSQLRRKGIAGCDSWTDLNVNQTVIDHVANQFAPVTVMGVQTTGWAVQWVHKSLEITTVNPTPCFENLWEIRYRFHADFQPCEECQWICLWAGLDDPWSTWEALEHNIWNICRRACDSVDVVVFQNHLSGFKYIFHFISLCINIRVLFGLCLMVHC